MSTTLVVPRSGEEVETGPDVPPGARVLAEPRPRDRVGNLRRRPEVGWSSKTPCHAHFGHPGDNTPVETTCQSGTRPRDVRSLGTTPLANQVSPVYRGWHGTSSEPWVFVVGVTRESRSLRTVGREQDGSPSTHRTNLNRRTGLHSHSPTGPECQCLLYGEHGRPDRWSFRRHTEWTRSSSDVPDLSVPGRAPNTQYTLSQVPPKLFV